MTKKQKCQSHFHSDILMLRHNIGYMWGNIENRHPDPVLIIYFATIFYRSLIYQI